MVKYVKNKLTVIRSNNQKRSLFKDILAV